MCMNLCVYVCRKIIWLKFDSHWHFPWINYKSNKFLVVKCKCLLLAKCIFTGKKNSEMQWNFGCPLLLSAQSVLDLNLPSTVLAAESTIQSWLTFTVQHCTSQSYNIVHVAIFMHRSTVAEVSTVQYILLVNRARLISNLKNLQICMCRKGYKTRRNSCQSLIRIWKELPVSYFLPLPNPPIFPPDFILLVI